VSFSIGLVPPIRLRFHPGDTDPVIPSNAEDHFVFHLPMMGVAHSLTVSSLNITPVPLRVLWTLSARCSASSTVAISPQR